MDQDLKQSSDALIRLSEFLLGHYSIINVCMVDFITKNVFDQVLDEDVGQELAQMSDEDIVYLPERCSKIQEDFNPDSASSLDKLLHSLSVQSLDNLGVVTSRDDACSKFQECASAALSLQHFDRIASDKKMHEVVVMSDVISRLATTLSVDSVIDLGSGKGYLSHVFAATHKNVKVVAVEGSDVNSEGAKKRKEKLEKRWDGLLRRALCRASGQEPPTRGKKWKSRIHENTENGDDQTENEKVEKNVEKNVDRALHDNLRFVTQFIDEKTDIDNLIERHFADSSDEDQNDVTKKRRQVEDLSTSIRRFGLVGLHTCGPLAVSSFRIFLAKKGARFCCNVGCCYHLLQEESALSVETPSFPVSSVLKDRNFRLGRNPLMLAAQPMDRSIANKELPDRALLWRSILQTILLRHKPDLKLEDQQVGRIAAKSENFHDYVRKALNKLQLGIEVSDEEISETYLRYECSHRQKLNSFYQLRSLFAPLIEGLVLLDRLIFLREQETISEAFLVKLFDAVISPRCYALIAIKK